METGSCYLFSSCPGWDRGWLGFCGGSAGKESACSAGDLGLIPGLGRSLGQGKGYPVQHPFLENAPGCIVPGAGKSRARSDRGLHSRLHLLSACPGRATGCLFQWFREELGVSGAGVAIAAVQAEAHGALDQGGGLG